MTSKYNITFKTSNTEQKVDIHIFKSLFSRRTSLQYTLFHCSRKWRDVLSIPRVSGGEGECKGNTKRGL